MCYKYLWDNLVSEKFPSDQFFEYFSLDSRCILSDEIKRLMVDSDFSAEVRYLPFPFYIVAVSTHEVSAVCLCDVVNRKL